MHFTLFSMLKNSSYVVLLSISSADLLSTIVESLKKNLFPWSVLFLSVPEQEKSVTIEIIIKQYFFNIISVNSSLSLIFCTEICKYFLILIIFENKKNRQVFLNFFQCSYDVSDTAAPSALDVSYNKIVK